MTAAGMDRTQTTTGRSAPRRSFAEHPMLDLSSKSIWTGRVLSGVAVLFLAFDVAIKLALAQPAVQATTALGFAAASTRPLGLIELACLALYVIPRSAPLGAVLLTGWLGGAIAAHLRHGDPLFSNVLFPTYVGLLLWAGLWLRDQRVRSLLRAR